MSILNLGPLLQAGRSSGAGTRASAHNAELPWRT